MLGFIWPLTKVQGLNWLKKFELVLFGPKEKYRGSIGLIFIQNSHQVGYNSFILILYNFDVSSLHALS